MKYSIEKLITPSKEVRYEVRIITRGRGGKQLKRRFESRKEADDFISATLTGEIKPLERSFQSILLKERYEAWRQDKSSKHAPQWKIKLDGYWDALKEFHNMPIMDVTPELMAKLESKYRAQGNSQATIIMKLGMLSSVVNHSLKKGAIKENPLATYEPLKSQETEMLFWEEDEALGFLDFANAKYPFGGARRQIFVAYLVALNCGLRGGEIWGLKPRCMKQSLGIMRITEQFDRVEKIFRPTKGKKNRSVPMNSEVEKELKALISDRKIGLNDTIFQNHEGRPMDHDHFVEWYFQKDIQEWGGTRIRFHDTRHTCGTMMLRQGVDIRTVQSILGHSDLKTTLRYLHVVSANVQDAGKKFQLKPREIKPALSIVNS